MMTRSAGEKLLKADESHAKDMGLRISRRPLEGRDLIAVAWSSDGTEREYVFDPAKGYSLVSAETVSRAVDGSNRRAMRYFATEFVEAAPGIWFPSRAYREMEQGGKRYRLVYVGTFIQINYHLFDERVFTVPFPMGYRIEDEARGLSYQVGQDPEHLEEQIGKLTPAALAATAPSVGTKGEPEVIALPQAKPGDGNPTRTNSNR